jgi:hypothetical protein
MFRSITAAAIAVALAGIVAAPTTAAWPVATDSAAAIDLDWERTDPSAAWADLAPCANEDGPGPCVWHADKVGNLAGSSFYIGTDFCTYRLDGQRDADFECVDAYAADAS